MEYALRPDQSLTDNLRRIARGQIARARAALQGFPADPESVHEARKCLKRLRALLRLARAGLGETYAQENAAFRDLGRSLAGLRDVESLLELLPVVRKSAPNELSRATLARLRRALNLRMPPLEAMQARVTQALVALEQTDQRVDHWPLLSDEPKLLAKGAARSYRSARRRMRAAYELASLEGFHEWRKQVKHHNYQLRLLKPLSPRLYGAQLKLVDELAQALGEEHDTALLRRELAGALGKVLSPATRRRWQAAGARFQNARRKQAWKLGHQAFAKGRRAFARHLITCYETARPAQIRS